MSQMDYQNCTVMHECAIDYSITRNNNNNIIMISGFAVHANTYGIILLDTEAESDHAVLIHVHVYSSIASVEFS